MTTDLYFSEGYLLGLLLSFCIWSLPALLLNLYFNKKIDFPPIIVWFGSIFGGWISILFFGMFWVFDKHEEKKRN